MREWQDFSLPSNELSQQNGIIINNCMRWPLIIDPQSQANLWIKKWLKSSGLVVVKFDDYNFNANLESCIKTGLPLLIENVEEWIDPVLDPILQKDIYKKGMTYFIKMSENEIQYSQEFKLFLTSRISNPHFVPELTIKVTVVNFSVTSEGLEDQLLAEVIKYERLDLEQQRIQLIKQISMDLNQIKHFEQTILLQITEAGSKILDDDKLVTTLENTKEMSFIIQDRMINANLTQESIQQAREHYRSIARRGSSLYFVISELSTLNHMYKWSLDYFLTFFKSRLEKSKQCNEQKERILILVEDITLNTYKTVCRGLFIKDKLLFSFILTIKIQLKNQELEKDQWQFFLNGMDPQKLLTMTDDQKPSFLDSFIWKTFSLQSQDDTRYFQILESLKSDEQQWIQFLNCDSPSKFDLQCLSLLNKFEQLCLYKTTHPEFIIDCVSHYIRDQMGDQLLQQFQLDLRECHAESFFYTPLIFILAKGADPMSYLNEFAIETVGASKFKTLSLGQGQGNKAKELISQARRNGEWVCLQNCHLAITWMPTLEKIQEEQDENNVHPYYRLWLTSQPNENFSVNVLQQGIKIIIEQPTGIKANLLRVYNGISENDYEISNQNDKYQKLLFNLAQFHSILSERKKFGPLGFNIQYDWQISDFQVSKAQLRGYCEELNYIPFQALNVLIGQLNYGGKITDFQDTRLINALIDDLFNENAAQGNNLSNYYQFPKELGLQNLIKYINQLPEIDDPKLFGLNNNAEIQFKLDFTNQFLQSIQSMQIRNIDDSQNTNNQDQIILKIIGQMESISSTQLNIRQLQKNNSIILFRNQEIQRYNQLITVIKQTIFDLQRAIKGLTIMSFDLETMYQEILENQIPRLWKNQSYLSVKPLGNWIIDFTKRLEFMRNWTLRQKMPQYLLSCFYFPQGFFTAVRFNHARENKLPIEKTNFQCKIKDNDYTPGNLKDGVVIYGLYLEACKINEQGQLDEQDNKQIITKCPFIEQSQIFNRLIPQIIQNNNENYYNCPVYKTYLRAGELNSTGHSTNYILSLDLKCTQDYKYWIRRGAALVCQIND